MLKLISLFYVLIFVLSCGGDTGTVYYNNNLSDKTNTGNSNNNSSSNDNSNIINKPKAEEIKCLPGAQCNKKESAIKIKQTKPCLPGVQC